MKENGREKGPSEIFKDLSGGLRLINPS